MKPTVAVMRSLKAMKNQGTFQVGVTLNNNESNLIQVVLLSSRDEIANFEAAINKDKFEIIDVTDLKDYNQLIEYLKESYFWNTVPEEDL